MAQGRRHPHNTHSDVASRFSTPWQPGAHLRSTAPDRVHRRLTARQPPRAHTAVRPKRCARPAKAARPCCSSSEAWPHDIDWDERTKRAPPRIPPPAQLAAPPATLLYPWGCIRPLGAVKLTRGSGTHRRRRHLRGDPLRFPRLISSQGATLIAGRPARCPGRHVRPLRHAHAAEPP